MKYTITEPSTGWVAGKTFEAECDDEATVILTEMGWKVLGRSAETLEGLPLGTVILEVEEVRP